MIGWRQEQTNNTTLGKSARSAEPAIWQLVISAPENSDISEQQFNALLYVIRRIAEKHDNGGLDKIYFPSLHTRTIVYKGERCCSCAVAVCALS